MGALGYPSRFVEHWDGRKFLVKFHGNHLVSSRMSMGVWAERRLAEVYRMFDRVQEDVMDAAAHAMRERLRW